MNYLDLLVAWLRDIAGIGDERTWRVLATILTLAGYFVARWLARLLARRGSDDPARIYKCSKASNYIPGLIAVVALLRVWIGRVENVMTYLAIVSAGIAVALRGPRANLAGWLIITFRRPFAVDDRMEIGGTAGDVIDVRLFQFSLVQIGNWVDANQSTGRIIHIPNAWVFEKALANPTAEFNFI